MARLLASVDSDTLLFPDSVMGALDGQYRSGLLITPSMNQATIQAALNELVTGDAVRFKGRGGAYGLTSPLTLPADGILVDAEDATFTQTVWAKPAFDLIGRNDLVLDLGTVEFDGTRGGVGSSYRGSSGYVSGAAVWINGDRNKVRQLHSVAMSVGVFLSSWNGTSANDRVGVGNRLGNVEVEGANFGLLYVGQNGMQVEEIYGHDDIDDSSGANPTHVVYGSAITSFRATGGRFESVRAKNILTGQPFQAKFHDGLSVGSLTAEDCKGLLNLMDCDDFVIDSYRGLRLLSNGGQGAITLQRSVTNSQRPSFGSGRVQHAANVDERVVNIIADDGEFDSITVESNHTSGVSAAAVGGDILVRGSRNTFRKPRVRALGGAVPAMYVGFGETANGTLVDHPEFSGTLSGVKVGSSSTGVVVNYDPLMQTITGATFLDTNSGVESVATSTAPARAISTLGENAIIAAMATAQPTTIANSAIEVKVTPRWTQVVNSFIWWSFTASGNYDVAIVDDATNAVLWSKGSTAWPAAGKITETVPSIKLIAGRTYRLAIAADNAVGQYRGVSAQIAGLDLRLDGSTATSIAASAFPIGNTTLAAGSSGSTRIPLIVLLS